MGQIYFITTGNNKNDSKKAPVLITGKTNRTVFYKVLDKDTYNVVGSDTLLQAETKVYTSQNGGKKVKRTRRRRRRVRKTSRKFYF